MNWTSEYPTSPGWYWLRRKSKLGVFRVRRVRGKLLVFKGKNRLLFNTQGEWYGPLKVPHNNEATDV